MSRGTYERSEFVTVRTIPARGTRIELIGSKPTDAWAARSAAHGEVGQRPLSCVLLSFLEIGSSKGQYFCTKIKNPGAEPLGMLVVYELEETELVELLRLSLVPYVVFNLLPVSFFRDG